MTGARSLSRQLKRASKAHARFAGTGKFQKRPKDANSSSRRELEKQKVQKGQKLQKGSFCNFLQLFAFFASLLLLHELKLAP
jgi:hypothetical protein